MAIKRFGPTLAAGVAVVEKEASKSIEPGARGIVAYTGICERGPVGKIEFCGDIKTFLKKYGGRTPDSELASCAYDYFEQSAGSGGIWVQRVTDGTEVKATLTLWSRQSVPAPVVRVDAQNGGAWAGRHLTFRGEYTDAGDLTETTLTTGLADRWKKNQLKGARLQLSDASGKEYIVLSNTAAGVITVSADSKMLTDSGAQADKGYLIDLGIENEWGEEKYLAVKVTDGAENPSTEWGLEVYVHGELVKTWPNLSSDPLSKRYFKSIINADSDNTYVTVEDLYTGDKTVAEVRPGNLVEVIPTTGVTATTLTLPAPRYAVTVGDANGTLGTWTYGTDLRSQTVTLTFSSATDFDVTSSIHGGAAGLLPAGTVGAPYAAPTDQMVGFTVTAGATVFEAGDVVTIYVRALLPDQLVGGHVYPDAVNSPRVKYRIVANTARLVTVAPGSDMTSIAETGDSFRLEYPEMLQGGYDGIAEIADEDYQAAYSISTSPWNNLAGKGQGLVKFATPGVTSTLVQQAGAAYCEAKNYQYRYEIPATTTDEAAAETYVSSTLGRNDYAVVSFPSYAQTQSVRPNSDGLLQTRTLTGKIHGVEAAFAKAYEGYHRAAAGVDAKLLGIVDLPTGLDKGKVLNEELLNPRGINVIVKKKGNWVLWGDKTCFLDSAWKWKHQREQMSAYEHDLMENFDWIVFQVNNIETRGLALAALSNYFEEEFLKSALEGASPEEAFAVQIDEGNNSTSDAQNGDLNADISLRLANTVERFVISIGKTGIIEQSA